MPLILIPMAYLALLAIPMAVIDIREHRLPNSMTVSTIALTAVSLTAIAILEDGWLGAVWGMVAGLVTFLVGFQLAKKDAIGMGDVKLLTSMNALAGYFNPLLPLISLTAGLVLATLVSIITMIFTKLDMKSPIPLGPYLLTGFFAAVSPAAVETTAAAWS
jgi:leader peptidase (prepilin peptidase)/N-methyltransferase